MFSPAVATDAATPGGWLDRDGQPPDGQLPDATAAGRAFEAAGR